MPVVLELVLIVPTFNLRTIPLWMIHYMVTLSKSGFLTFDTIYIWGQIILFLGVGYLFCAL